MVDFIRLETFRLLSGISFLLRGFNFPHLFQDLPADE